MPIFKGKDGEILPSRRNPRGKYGDDDVESSFIKKRSLLCPSCKKAFNEFIKDKNSVIPKTCDKCKEYMKELSIGMGKVR